MSTSGPFAPPADRGDAGSGMSSVIGMWGMAGAAVGTLVGATLQLVGVADAIVPFGLGSAAGFAIIGAGAWTAERRWAAERPALVDGSGRQTRPTRLWLSATPLAVGVAGLLGLVVIGSVRQGSVVPGIGFGVAALGFGALFRPLATRSRIAVALESLETGDVAGARRAFQRVHAAWWSSRQGRAQAQLNLGLLALRDGDLEAAGRWYVLPDSGRAAAFAATGLALVRVIEGRYDIVESLLRQARSGGGGLSVQGEIDGVRLLLVLRRDGPDDALVAGERLYDPTGGGLFAAALAAARLATGDRDGARALIGAGELDPVVRRALPELEDL